MAYGPDTADVFHRSASYIDRILKGLQVGRKVVRLSVR